MRFIQVISGTVLLTSCGFQSGGSESLEDTLVDAAYVINSEGQNALGIPGTVSARVEGNTLVIKLENLPTGNITLDENSLRKQLRPGVCDEWAMRSVIDRGGAFRVEMISNIGTAQPPVTISHC